MPPEVAGRPPARNTIRAVAPRTRTIPRIASPQRRPERERDVAGAAATATGGAPNVPLSATGSSRWSGRRSAGSYGGAASAAGASVAGPEGAPDGAPDGPHDAADGAVADDGDSDGHGWVGLSAPAAGSRDGGADWSGVVGSGVVGSGTVGSCPGSPGVRGSVMAVPSLAPAREGRHGGLATASAELLHELGQLGVLLDQSVDFSQVRSRAGRDPPPARAIQDGGVAPLALGHRADDRLDAPEIAAIDGVLRLLGHPAHARDHRHQLAHRAHLLDLLDLLQDFLEGELRLAELLLELGRLRRVDVLLGPLDEGHDVAHAEDPTSEPVGM